MPDDCIIKLIVERDKEYDDRLDVICLNYGRSALFENPLVQEWKDRIGKGPDKQGSLISPFPKRGNV